jgi:putative intracellular protease/amidase
MINRVLMVVSSRGQLGETDQPTGAWLEELAASYYVFLDAGCEIELASPRGGKAPIDPLSLNDPWVSADGARFVADTAAQAKLAATLSLVVVKPEQFRAVYLVGGAATAWDFFDNADLTAIVESLHQAGCPVAGVCHGVLGLTHARDANGVALVHGRSVTGISNAEEILTGFDKLVPILPENHLRSLGARYSCAPPFETHVMVDSGVLTGQNPASAGPLARAVLNELVRIATVSAASEAGQRGS